ncbi:MAG: cyclic nucleotide-binding domain-containing protein [Ilumatobacteraceae bacterium]
MSNTKRSALGNGALVRFAAANLLALAAEWAFFVGALVYAFDKGGARTAGLASLALLVPTAIAAPTAGAMAHRKRPQRVRLAALGGQTLALGAASVAAFADSPAAVVVGCCAVAAAAFTFLGPAGAVLLPGIVRSARELTTANVWVGLCDSISMLGGSLLATALLAIEGPASVLAGGAALTLVGTFITLSHSSNDSPPASYEDAPETVGAIRLVLRSIAVLKDRAGATGVLAVAGGQYLLMGSLDLIVVVLANDLSLGDSGPGVLSTSVGIGALVCAIVSAFLVRRDRLAPLLVGSIVGIAVACIVLGLLPALATALILLPIAGFGGALMHLTSRMLLQRATPPDATAGVFAAIELLAGVGLIVGSIVAQILIAVGDVETALVGLGVVFAILLFITWRSLKTADDSADIPIVTINLLRRIPAFSPLPALILETLARAATEVSVTTGQVVVSEGEEGDLFYAVADGSFDVVIRGTLVKTVGRGEGFGEIALLANVPRTATVKASRSGSLMAIHRVPFLIAVTGTDSSRQAAWGVVRAMDRDDRPEVPFLDG